MSSCPAYFEPIRQKARKRWEQLEGDPELAAPWHQLFRQVQSPRHIVSELLQNADDAGATEAAVYLEDGAFIFEHNGEDFSDEHFASLCRFGYSNKRALHTIGFRGIGFKSTFSLGSCVELYTPTLSVAFDQKRFTEPTWLGGKRGKAGLTTVRVEISDDNRRAEVEKNLRDWLASPISLLFFNNIRRIRIGDNELHWDSFGPGPIPDTEWLALNENAEKPFLMARSAPAPFSEEALAEIKQERNLTDEEVAAFPPCTIEIVLGTESRLFVVLPTGVKTALPFACNAPFIQDPARLKIKDPETSPTNRWLLERAGALAAKVMLRWLRDSDANPVERASAYDLLPDVDRSDSSLEGTCATIVEAAFADIIEDQEILLTDEGHLVGAKRSVSIPRPIFDVWPGDQAAALLDDDGRPNLSHHISDANKAKLVNWDFVDEIDDEGVLNALQNRTLPRPQGWRKLLALWSYLAPLISGYRYYRNNDGLCVVPVQGKDVLCAAKDVVRLGEKKMLPSEADWEFLGDRLSVVNQNWLRFLTEQRRVAESNDDHDLDERVDAAHAVLKAISLHEPSDTGKVIDQVAADFFRQGELTKDTAIRLSQIAAKLSASVGDEFSFVCRDDEFRTCGDTIVFDADGQLELLLPDEWANKHLLHPDYVGQFVSCTKEEWERWISSGRSGIDTFVPLESTRSRFWSRNGIDQELARRGYQGQFPARYQSPDFVCEDWDFPSGIWSHWEKIAKEDDNVWARVTEMVLTGPDRYWKGHLTAKVIERASNGATRNVIREGLAPSWILKLREQNCLRDTHGFFRKPVELLRRTPETEALMDVEPFIHGLVDNETTRPLLKLLGVGDKPTGPDKLLGRLQTLAKAEGAPAHEIEKWYRRLDQMVDGCSTEDFHLIKDTFSEERLILTEEGIWETSKGVFLGANEEDAPGAPTVRSAVSDLTLWRKIGVADRPTADLAIAWLTTLPSGKVLSKEDTRRVRSLQSRYSARIWEECQHWMSLAGEWTPVEELDYALTMQTLIPWSHLHQWVKRKTADLQQLSHDIIEAPPFSSLAPLATNIEEKFNRPVLNLRTGETKNWLQQLGKGLARIQLDDEEETERVRALGSELAATGWVTTSNLELISYIDGKPAGTPRRADAIWTEGTLFVGDRPVARVAKAVSQELGRSFRRPDIADAIKLCFDRPAEFVAEYMEENFSLAAREDVSNAPSEPSSEETHQETQDIITEDAHPVDEPEPDSESPVATDTDTPEERTSDEDTSDAPLEPTTDDANDTDTAPAPRPKPKPAKPSIIERFAVLNGFQKDAENRFCDPKGNCIAKSNSSLFAWELRSASGDIVRHYYPKDHCLQRDPLQLEAEIWSVLEKKPETYALLLSTPDGKPLEVLGTRIKEMRDCGEITLHPSTYRLVYENGR